MPNFIPNKPTPLFQKPPFFEDIKAADVPGRRTEKKVSVLQGEVVEALVKLGAIGVYFLDGTFDGSPKRYGFAVHFTLQGIPARIDIAALPLRSDANKDRALAQALFLLRNRLEAQYYAAAYEPGLIPLLPYLIGPDGRILYQPDPTHLAKLLRVLDRNSIPVFYKGNLDQTPRREEFPTKGRLNHVLD